MKFYAHFVKPLSGNMSDRVNEIDSDSLEEAETLARAMTFNGYALNKVLTWKELVEQEPGWAHVFKWKEGIGQEKPEQNKNRRSLSDDQVSKLLKDRERGMSYKDLKSKYKISESRISELVNGKSYKE